MTGKDNPFNLIFDAASLTESTAPPQPETLQPPESPPDPEPKQRGRPRGKKSDPEYEAAIAYIRKKTHIQVKRLLLDQEELGEKQDFSTLVQELLELWVEIKLGAEPEILIARFSDIRKSESLTRPEGL
jgi:hypothetical protein